MAYGEKYNLEFSDLKGVVWRAGIFKKDYVGISSKIKATGTPLEVNWKGGDLFDPIRASECIFSAYSDTNFKYSEFFDADVFDYLIQIKKAGSLWWEGVIVTENYSEPYTDIPYPVQLRFSDGLGVLKYIEYNDWSNNTDTKANLIFLIDYCLRELPYEKNMVEIVNILEDDVADIVTNGTLNTTYLLKAAFSKFEKIEMEEIPSQSVIINVMREIGWSCYEVIKQILISLGCSIYQSDNKWYIIRTEEYEKPTPAFIEYIPNGGDYDYTISEGIDSTGNLAIRKTITNTDAGITWLNQDAAMNISDVFGRLYYTYLFRRIGWLIGSVNFEFITTNQLITDPTFALQVPFSPAIKYWDWNGMAVGTDFDFIALDLNPGVIQSSGVKFYRSALSQTTVFNSNLWIKALETEFDSVSRKDTYITTNDTISIAVPLRIRMKFDDFAYSDLDQDYTLTVWMKLQIGTLYLREDSDGNLSWSINPASKFSIKYTFNMTEFYSGNFDLAIPEATLFYKFDINEISALETPSPPSNELGDMTFTIYCPENPVLNLLNIYCEAVVMSSARLVINIDNKRLMNEKTILQINDGIKRRKKNVTVLFSDGPHGTIKSTFKTQISETTSSWFKRGAIGVLESAEEFFILEPYRRYYSQYRRELNGTLSGDIDFWNTIKSRDNLIYLQASLSYSIKAVELKVKLLEIKEATPPITVISPAALVVRTDFDEPDSNGDEYVKQEANKRSMTNFDTGNLNNLNLTKRASVIIRIDDGRTNDDNYNDYPV